MNGSLNITNEENVDVTLTPLQYAKIKLAQAMLSRNGNLLNSHIRNIKEWAEDLMEDD